MEYNYFVKLFKFWIIRTIYDLLMFICGLFQCYQCHKYTIYFKLIILTLNYNDIYHTIVWFTVVEKYSHRSWCAWQWQHVSGEGPNDVDVQEPLQRGTNWCTGFTIALLPPIWKGKSLKSIVTLAFSIKIR